MLSRRALAVAFLLCFLVRFAAGVVVARRGGPHLPDAREYHELARNLSAGRGYLVEHVRWFECPRPTPAPDYSRPPLFPVCLAAAYLVLPDSLYVAAAVQAVLGAAACLLCAAVARALWDERAGLVALVIAGIHPPFVYYSAFPLTETLMSLLVGGLVLALVAVEREADAPPGRSFVRAGIAGLVLGLSALCRPVMLLGFAAVPLWAIVALRCGRLRRTALAAIVLAAAVLTVTPWTVRNLVSARAFFPVTNLGGYAFWLGNNENNFRAYASPGYRDFIAHQERCFDEATPRLLSKLCRGGEVSPKGQERFWRAEGLRFVRENPGKYLFLACARTMHFFRPWVNPAVYGWPAAAASLVLWGVLFVAGAVGLARLWRKERAAALAFLAVVLSGAAAHALTHVMVRHRVPFLDVAAVCLAAPVLLDWSRACLGRWTGGREAAGEEKT